MKTQAPLEIASLTFAIPACAPAHQVYSQAVMSRFAKSPHHRGLWFRSLKNAHVGSGKRPKKNKRL